MKQKNKNGSGCITSFTNCIQYNGTDIPCLGIYNGDNVNEIIAIIIDNICEIAQPQDLSSLSIQCLLDNFSNVTEPISKNIVSYLQLLINNDCTLKELIDNINLRIDGITKNNLVLDLKCLSTIDSFGNQLPYTEQSVLQSLINETCAHKQLISTLSGRFTILENLVNNFISNPPDPQLPLVTNCLVTNKSLAIAINTNAAKTCSLEALYGNSNKVSKTISQQCPDLNTYFSSNSQFIQNPSALADSDNNQWVTICNMWDRLKTLEECACKLKCSDIKLGWQINDNEDGDGVTLDFSGAFGNNIDSNYTDCGSTVTFIDVNKKKKTYTLNLSQTFTSPEFDLSMLDLTKLIVVKVCAKLCYNGEQCCLCEETEHLVVNGTCNVCDVVITGTTGSATISYVHNGNTTSIIANVGEVIYIPKDAINVTYITNSGDAAPDLGTTCLTITASSLKCYVLHWETNLTEAPLEDAYFTNVRFANNTSAIVSGQYEDYSNTFIDPPAKQLGRSINNLNNPKFKASCYTVQGGPNVHNHKLYISMDESLHPALFVIEQPTGIGNTKMFIETVEISTSQCSCDNGEITNFSNT